MLRSIIDPSRTVTVEKAKALCKVDHFTARSTQIVVAEELLVPGVRVVCGAEY